MKTSQIAPKDYVLATKYRDGDAQDAWAIGFYSGAYDHFGTTRHLVVDSEGNQFRANGFRRVGKISKERGAWLVANMRWIELSGRSVWHFARCKMVSLTPPE